jgi:TfoX/Sxy family transcriptional regulator of competence genes
MSEAAEDEWEAICARLLAADDAIELKRAMSSPGLRYDDKIFAMLVRGDFVVKVEAARAAALVDDGCAPLTMGTRVMREWVVIPHDRIAGWSALADEALEYARTLAATRRR